MTFWIRMCHTMQQTGYHLLHPLCYVSSSHHCVCSNGLESCYPRVCLSISNSTLPISKHSSTLRRWPANTKARALLNSSLASSCEAVMNNKPSTISQPTLSERSCTLLTERQLCPIMRPIGSRLLNGQDRQSPWYTDISRS